MDTVNRVNYGVGSVRKMWLVPRCDGIDFGRGQTARLMRLAAVSNKGKGRLPITTRWPNVPVLCPELVRREFKAQGPNKLWVADATYVCAEETTGLVPHSDHGSQPVSVVYNERISQYGIALPPELSAIPMTML